MPLIICFPVQGREICVQIPVLIPNRPGPDPDPWMHGLDVSRQDLGLLQQLSTVARVVETLPAESQSLFAAPMERAIQAHAKNLGGASVKWQHSGPGPDPAFSAH